MTEQALVPIVAELAPVLARPLPVDRHPVAVYLARLAPGSRRTMSQALQVVAGIFGQRPDTLDWAALRYQHTQAIRARLLVGRAPAGVDKIVAALRGVLKEAWRLGLMDAETYHRAADLPGVRGERLARGRALKRRELQRLFQACAKGEKPAERRDADCRVCFSLQPFLVRLVEDTYGRRSFCRLGDERSERGEGS